MSRNNCTSNNWTMTLSKTKNGTVIFVFSFCKLIFFIKKKIFKNEIISKKENYARLKIFF